MTNAEIVEYYMNDDNGGNLPQKCVDCQFSKLAKTEPWKYQYKDDFYDDLIIILLEYNHEKLLNAHENGHMNALITRIIFAEKSLTNSCQTQSEVTGNILLSKLV